MSGKVDAALGVVELGNALKGVFEEWSWSRDEEAQHDNGIFTLL